MTNRVPFVQFFPRAEKLHHVLRSLQHVIDDKHLAKIFPTLSLLAFKQALNLKQIIIRSTLPNLQDNIDHTTLPWQPLQDMPDHLLWILPSHVGTPPTMCIADIDVTWPVLSISNAASKDAL
eukprot:g43343.t1